MNVRALLLTGPAFDLILPSDREYAENPEVQLIPYGVVESFIRNSLEHDDELIEVLTALRNKFVRACLLGPPPPLPESAVRTRLGQSPYFVEAMQQMSLTIDDAIIVSDPVRSRLYSVLLETYASFATAHGVDFVPPPTAALTEDGMLASAFWGEDVTHGNALYGAAYMDELLDWLAADKAHA